MAGKSNIDEQTWRQLLYEYLRGKTVAQIAAKTGLSTSWVRRCLNGRKAAIREMLETGEIGSGLVDRLVLAVAGLDANEFDEARRVALAVEAIVRASRHVERALEAKRNGAGEAGQDDDIEDDIADPRAELHRRVARLRGPAATADAGRDRGDDAASGAGSLL